MSACRRGSNLYRELVAELAYPVEVPMRGQPKDGVVVGVMYDHLVTVEDGMNCLNPYVACLSVFFEDGVGPSSDYSVEDSVVGHSCCSAKDCCIDERAVIALYAVRTMHPFVDAVHSGCIGDYVAVVLEEFFRCELVVRMEDEVVGFSAR